MLKKLEKQVREVSKAFEKNNQLELKFLSNDLIKEASVSNDKLKAKIAVIAYGFYKLLSKQHIVESAKWLKTKKQVLKTLNEMTKLLQEKKASEFERKLDGISLQVSKIDVALGNYAQTTIEKARVKIASTAFSFGLSLKQASELTGADSREVFSYIGKTKMNEEKGISFGISERLKRLEEALA